MRIPPRAVVLALIAVAALSTSGLLEPSRADQAPTAWTIMLYMADDATPELPWQDNVNAMEAANQAPGTSIIALVDPLGDGNSQLLRVQQDPNGADPALASTPIEDNGAVIPVSGEVNMADPSTLKNFIGFSLSHYPADRTVLVLWGHGAGWAGICPDGTDLLTLPKLRQGLNGTGIWSPLDLIAVDACAAATFEMLYEVRGLADYFVAAEGNVPFQGLPYTKILNALALDPSMSITDFGSIIVQHYIQAAWRSSPYSTTMALFDLARIDQVVADLSTLSSIGFAYDSIFHGTINDAVNAAESYDTLFYFDFGDFLSILEGSSLPLKLKMQAISVELSYQNLILAFDKFDNPDPVDGIHVRNATGASIYAPSTSFADSLYADLALASTEWYEFGQAARTVKLTDPKSPGPSLTYADSPADNDTLPDSVMASWDGVYDDYELMVFRQEIGGYVFLESITSTTQNINVSGIVGNLLLAATASSGGVAKTYDELNMTLYGTIAMTVRVIEDGTPSAGAYEVRVVIDNMNWSFVAEAGEAVVNLSVPSQVSIGDMILIEILKPGSQTALGSNRTVVLDRNYAVSVDIFQPEKNTQGFYVMLGLAALPGILVLAFAVMLYWDYRKQRS